MDWQSVGVNLAISTASVIFLIFANWIVGEWDRHSKWGQWKRVFLKYDPVAQIYNRVYTETNRILGKLTTPGGYLFIFSAVLLVAEVVFSPVIASWMNKSLEETYYLFLDSFYFVELVAILLILYGIFFVMLLKQFSKKGHNLESIIPFFDNVHFRIIRSFVVSSLKDYLGSTRYSTYAIYFGIIGIVITKFNIEGPDFPALAKLVFLQVFIAVGVALLGRYSKLTLFNMLWKQKLGDNIIYKFPYVSVTLKSGHSLRGQLVDFTDKSILVLRHGKEYIHVPWNEIEVIRVLNQ